MKYEITKDNPKEFLAQLINQLALVEVKGDSVEHLFVARMGLRELFEAIQEIPEQRDSNAEGGI